MATSLIEQQADGHNDSADVERRVQHFCSVMDYLEAKMGTVAGREFAAKSSARIDVCFDRGYSPAECAERLFVDHIASGASVPSSSRPVVRVGNLGSRDSSFVNVIGALREAGKCPTCDKTRVVVNVARRGFKAERISLDTHCGCAGGPAAHLKKEQQS
jgi:hypothetical protein